MLICIFDVREAGLHEFIECDTEHGFDAMTLTVQNSSVNMELPACKKSLRIFNNRV